MRFLLFILFLVLNVKSVFAYPDFISYGYKSCLTCHFTAGGGGALNDYGRALYATEITARSFANQNLTEEQMGDSSGFLGSTELPNWLRPAFKYRGLWVRRSAFESSAVERFIQMQADAYLTVPLDKKQKYVISASIGYQPVPDRLRSLPASEQPSEWVSREHYFRWQASRNLFVYLGLLDKMYGIRHADHTAVNRSLLGFGQNDQSHGALVFWSNNKWTFAGHGFIGNLSQEAAVRQVGGSFFSEYDLGQNHVIGTSLLVSGSEVLEQQRAAFHTRYGFAKGRSLMYETGFKADKPKNTGEMTTGWYNYFQGLIAWKRGYNFLTTFQTYNDQLSSNSTIDSRWGLGVLAFPFPRTEVRAELLNSRRSSTSPASKDQWTAQAQVHLSW